MGCEDERENNREEEKKRRGEEERTKYWEVTEKRDQIHNAGLVQHEYPVDPAKEAQMAWIQPAYGTVTPGASSLVQEEKQAERLHEDCIHHHRHHGAQLIAIEPSSSHSASWEPISFLPYSHLRLGLILPLAPSLS